MSGGVDSSLAAALAKEAGHEVLGVTMQLTRKEQFDAPGFINHGSIEEANDAKQVADRIDIPFETWDMSALYKDRVVQEFVRSYARGETPNPCVSCNQNVKFAALVAKARERGYDMVATGHYARIIRNGESGFQHTDTDSREPQLHRGVNLAKDQSYFVASMPPEVVQYCYFPLGEFYDKAKVRKMAKEFGFVTHDKKDSSDICFLAKNAKSQFLGAQLNEDFAGEIVDETGQVLGTHTGYWNYTIGQRQGLNIKTARKDGKPRYVIDIDANTKQVIVGPKHLLEKKSISCDEVKFFDKYTQKKLQASSNPPVEARAQIRAHGAAIPVKLTYMSNSLRVVALNDCFEAVARGQSLVIYDLQKNSRVLIKATIRNAKYP